jgi:hypothetical protein
MDPEDVTAYRAMTAEHRIDLALEICLGARRFRGGELFGQRRHPLDQFNHPVVPRFVICIGKINTTDWQSVYDAGSHFEIPAGYQVSRRIEARTLPGRHDQRFLDRFEKSRRRVVRL